MIPSSPFSSQPPTTARKLTAKQRAFINLYMANGFNGGKAAMKAGYAEASAYVEASRLLRNANVQAEIRRLMHDFVMPAEEVLLRLTEHARGDLGDLLTAAGAFDWTTAHDSGQTRLVKRLKRKTIKTTSRDGKADIETIDEEIELHNPQVALQLLGKYHEIFADKLKIEITWQDEAAALIKAGEMTYETALETFDHDDRLVRELFAKAQIPVSTGQGEASQSASAPAADPLSSRPGADRG